MTAETALDPTTLYMAKRLSALPASIREEVIEVVAEVVDAFTDSRAVLDCLARQRCQGLVLSEQARSILKRYHLAMFLGIHTHFVVQGAIQQYQTVMNATAGTAGHGANQPQRGTIRR
jgi:hypothetical protein